MTDDERKFFEQKIEELTRTNDKCSQYIARREQEQRHREKISMNTQQFDEVKRKYNDEIHRLYDQVNDKQFESKKKLFIRIVSDRQTKSTAIDSNR